MAINETQNEDEVLKQEYHRDNFLYIIKEKLFNDFKKDEHEYFKADFNNKLFLNIIELGVVKSLNVMIYEVLLSDRVKTGRIAITQEMFKVLKQHIKMNAIVAFVSADKKTYRLSLLTSKYELDDNNKIISILSNPRRYS